MFDIPVYRPWLTDEEKNNVLDCLESGWISSKGKYVEKFEAAFAEYVGCEYAASVCNGTVALHLALAALGVGPGDEVIVPTLTYVASVNAIMYVGAQPVFVDSTVSNWNLDIDDVKRAITSKTKAIIAVHLYGHPADMVSLRELCDEHDLLLIEDCAEALGAYIGDQHVGVYGDISTFSFYGNKTITTGEGGMVITRSSSLAERLVHMRGQGLAKHREYWHDIIGFNFRMTNVCAAIGLAQLSRIKDIQQRKNHIAASYRQQLEDYIDFQPTTPGTIHSHWMVCGLVSKTQQRDPLREHLKKEGIETRPLFYPVHSMPMYLHRFRRMPISEMLSSRGINLPSYPELTDSEIDRVCQAIKGFEHGH